MANVIRSSQRERSLAFDHLVDKQFDIIPGGRDALCRGIGREAIRLESIIDNYFLPNITSSGDIYLPDNFDINSEMTALIPVLESDTELYINENSSDIIIPTLQQCRVGNFSQDEHERRELFSEKSMYCVNDYINDALLNKDYGTVCGMYDNEDNKTIYSRPVTVVDPRVSYRKLDGRITTMQIFMHETEHVRQTLEWLPPAKGEALVGNVERELHAYVMSANVGATACKLMGIKDDQIEYNFSRNYVKLLVEYGQNNKHSNESFDVKSFIDWFHTERIWSSEELLIKKDLWTALSDEQ